MIESKQFAGGGMNQDVNENYLKPNEWQSARNIRVTDKLEGAEGIVSNVLGNTLITYSLPVGTNKCIGNYANEQTGKHYSFIWNSNNSHTITEYDASAGTITTVLQGSFLNFQQYELINGVGIVDDNLLYWTDGYNPPRGIEIDKAKTGTWYTTSASISLVKRPPQELIVAQYANDPNTSTASNRLKNQLFQFRYLYVYQDNTRSAWSSISEMPLPNLEISSTVDTTPYKNNHISLQFNIGDKYVKSIEIAAIAKGETAAGASNDWFTILSIDRAYLTSYPGVMEFLYDSITNTCTYNFYNDGLYQTVDVKEVDLQFDYVPLTSKTLEVVNGNVLVLGNNTEGYDNVSNFNVELTVDYQVPGIQKLTAVADTGAGVAFQMSGVPVGDGTAPPNSDEITASWFWQYTDGLDIITVNYTYTYYVPAAYSGNLYDTIVDFGNSLAAYSESQNPSNYYELLDVELQSSTSVRLIFTKVGNPQSLILAVENADGFNNSTHSYKSNSKYQFGVVYYDEFNRSTYVQTNERDAASSSGGCIVSTNSWGAESGETPVINWEIKNTAPTWASKYQWVRTEQLTHKTFLFWTASAVSVNVDNANLYDLNINSFNTYNTDNPNSILSYEYTPGDRCTVHKDSTGWISAYDVSVVDYKPDTGILTIQKAGTLSVDVEAPILLEIYTPKTRNNSSTEQFFYEFGEVYSCTGGVHAVTSGTFTEGDIYTKSRIISEETVILEDPNFSDFYISNFSSNGRTNIYAPQAKQLNLPTDIRYSDTYVPNTNINGLSRFYGDAFETYDRVNGSIQKLSVRDNYLFTFQELKTGYIPIEQSIIEDQGGANPNVAISTKLLNKIRYLAGDYGIGKHPESFAKFAGTMYFADPNRTQVLKLTSGIQPISSAGMDKYFTTKLSEFNELTNAKIHGSYDPYNDEYIIAFKVTSGSSEDDETIAWSEAINRWTTFYDFHPDISGYIFNKYFTYKDGRMWEHNVNASRNSFYGVNWTSDIAVVFNGSPGLIKSFIGLMEQSTTTWSPEGSIRTSLGQSSDLTLGDFYYKEGAYMASFFKADNSPGGLISGDDLKGNWIKFTLANGNFEAEALQALHMRFIPSNQGIK